MYKEPFHAIDERFQRADGAIMPEGRGSVDKIALHHYVLKCDVSSANCLRRPIDVDALGNAMLECTAFATGSSFKRLALFVHEVAAGFS